MDVDMFDNETASKEMVVDLQETAESPPSNCNNGRLSLPAQLPDGQLTVQFYDINSMRHVQLSDLCRIYKLPHSGTIPKLKERLRKFSRDPQAADSRKPYTRNSHLGPKTGNTSSQKKKSAQRREALFENVPPPSTTLGLPVLLSTAVSLKQREHDLAWASSIVQRYPYRTKEMHLKIAEGRLAARTYLRGSDGSIECATDQSIKKGLDDANANITKLLDYITTGPLADCTANTIDNTGTSHFHNPATNDQQLANPVSTFSLPVALSLPPTEGLSTSATTRTIVLHSGLTLTFTEAEVPPPPAISFAKNLPSLNRMWDDHSEHWDRQSVLVIKGTPIPICYWKDIYTSKGSPKGRLWKQNQWKGLKGRWFEWKVHLFTSSAHEVVIDTIQVLIKEWRRGSPDEFWAHFVVDGKPLGYKAILDKLAEWRGVENNMLCERAKLEYGEQFSSIFSYTKNGRKCVKTKASDVAKQYRELQGIQDNDDDDE
ncbi:unnamed protein product [Cyclocybe aegerita]|uniref:SAP domain-containing protein n=1 Tax=Cyclocybe aegerita TaxID=1973307 RepID=A0A8S0X1E1_CYCAE|nr:unnamed protein product [Cyclocybe aegerita]